jgi:hypothetical protein
MDMGSEFRIPAKGMHHCHNTGKEAFAGIPVGKRLVDRGVEHVEIRLPVYPEERAKLRGRVKDNMPVDGIGKQDRILLYPALRLPDPAGGTEA